MQVAQAGQAEKRSFAEVVESFLKWFSIAYGLGFVTVLLNTAPFGIPTLEIAEPAQIWVGLPLAIVFWVLVQMARHFGAKKETLEKEIADLQVEFTAIHDAAQAGKTDEAMVRLLTVFGDSALRILPLMGFDRLRKPIAREAGEILASRLTKKFSGTKSLADELKAARRLMIWTNAFMRIVNLVNRAFKAFVPVIIIGGVYIFVLYPKMPQRWGGGAPVTVRMLLAEEKVPLDEATLKPLFPDEGGSEGAKMRLTKPVTLLYSTEHAYYIVLDKQTLSVSAEAVGGVLFDAPHRLF